jgi:hypothetical protein
MKNLKLSIIAMALLLMSCGNKNEANGAQTNSGDNTLSGSWEVTKAEGMMAESNIGTKYIFDTASLTFSKDGFDNKANSAQTDSTFTWDNGNMTMEYSYTFEGNNLVVKPKGGDQVLYLERK